jgi:hypothetical protein
VVSLRGEFEWAQKKINPGNDPEGRTCAGVTRGGARGLPSSVPQAYDAAASRRDDLKGGVSW